MSARAKFSLILMLAASGVLSWSLMSVRPPLTPRSAHLETATFAGGCYWCMQPVFDHLTGVVSVTAGYAGDGKERRESVEVVFDPARTSYRELLTVFWRNIDPLNDAGQFCDDGSDYRSGIFVHDEEQQRLAVESKAAIEATKKLKVVTAILPAGTFLPAGEYDQNYGRKHPVRYRFYRLNCGRDARLYEVWGDQR